MGRSPELLNKVAALSRDNAVEAPKANCSSSTAQIEELQQNQAGFQLTLQTNEGAVSYRRTSGSARLPSFAPAALRCAC
jgi:hypothetical protein